MKRTVVLVAVVDGDDDNRSGQYIADALEVGLDGGPAEDYNVTGVTLAGFGETAFSPEWDDAMDRIKGFDPLLQSDFYERLGNAARSISEHMEEDDQERDQ